MDEQQLREIAEAAFKRQFSDVEIVRINVRQRLDHDDDEGGQVTGRGDSCVALEVLDKTWREGKVNLGYPLVHLLVKAGLNQRDPVTV